MAADVPLPGARGQVEAALADSQALYILWAGGHDIGNWLDYGQPDIAAEPPAASRRAAPERLIGAGAWHILVSTMPDMGRPRSMPVSTRPPAPRRQPRSLWSKRRFRPPRLAFAGGVAGFKAFLMLGYLREIRRPGLSRLCVIYGAINAVQAALWLGWIRAEPSLRLAPWALALARDIVTPLTGSARNPPSAAAPRTPA